MQIRIFLVYILFLGCRSETPKHLEQNFNKKNIYFLNNSGYIKFCVDSFLNDSYFCYSSNCEYLGWEHTLKYECFPKVYHHFLNKGYSDLIYYLTISYSHTPDVIENTKSLFSGGTLNANYRSPDSLDKFIEGYTLTYKPLRQNHHILYIDDMIKIKLESNLHSLQELKCIFMDLLLSIELKFYPEKLQFSLYGMDWDSLICVTNNINSINPYSNYNKSGY